MANQKELDRVKKKVKEDPVSKVWIQMKKTRDNR
jgi:hypothetical protein